MNVINKNSSQNLTGCVSLSGRMILYAQLKNAQLIMLYPKYLKDSTVSVESDGLVGDKFVKIDPGKAKDFLAPNDFFNNTKDFKTIEDMVGEIIFMVTDDGSKDEN